MKEAFLIHKGTLYFTRVPFFHSPIETPITRLIGGLWANEPNSALRMLRERIYTNYELAPLCMGTLKVAAKRYQTLSESEFSKSVQAFHGPRVEVEPAPLSIFNHPETPLPGSALPRGEIIQTLNQLVGSFSETRSKLSSEERSVATILLSADQRVISYAWNSGQKNRAQHAELSLAQNFFAQHQAGFPEGSCLFVTLKPCAMCSSFILAMSPAKNFSIEFLFDDPGPASKNSCLVPGTDLWKKAGQPKISMTQIKEKQD